MVLFTRYKLAMVAVVLLAVFMMSIVWINYVSQVELRETSLIQFKDHAASEAASISHFFLERSNDIDGLSASREILAYFENEALGMSKEYGLWASMVGMSELFERFASKKVLNSTFVYKRVAFFDATGKLLADNYGAVGGTAENGLKLPVNSLDDRVDIRIEEEGGRLKLIMLLPYVFKGQFVGTIVAWVNPEVLLSVVLNRVGKNDRVGIQFFVYKSNLFSAQTSIPARLVEEARDGRLPLAGEVLERDYQFGMEGLCPFLITCSPIDGTPFCLLSLSPKRDVLGPLAPWKLLVFSFVLALLLMAGGIVTLKVSARNLILNVQIDESVKQARSIESKNQQLEEEVSARKSAEEKLLKVKDALEARVEERTSALRKQADTLSLEVAERREAENAMRLIFNNTNDAIFIHDMEGRIIDINERVVELYGVERQDVLSFDIAKDFSGEENPVDTLKDKWAKTLDGNEVVFDWVAKRPSDGSLFDVEVTLNRIEIGGETVILANVHDVSQQKKTQAQQEEHQEFLNTIFEGIGAAIFVFDPSKGAMVDCNVVGENLLSLSREDILDASCRINYIFKAGSPKDLLCPDWHDQGSYDEGILSLPDGSTLPVSRQLFEVHIGGRGHLVEVVFDVTERKNLEMKLNVAQKLESIGLLASGIAHEINTPIQYIGDSVRFVKEMFEDTHTLLDLYGKAFEKPGDEKAVAEIKREIEAFEEEMDIEFALKETPKACDRALDGVQRVATIVLAMKNFSHPGEEKTKAVDINKAIWNTVTVTRNEWKYAADLETDLDSSLPLVHCLPGGINQVLLNVIVNAAHAIAECAQGHEKGTIDISTSSDDEFVEIRIKDSGCGISEENQAKIFDPFFTTKEVGKGTGQGLAIVHDIIVEKHGGAIDIVSELGKGTTFIIRLPIRGVE